MDYYFYLYYRNYCPYWTVWRNEKNRCVDVMTRKLNTYLEMSGRTLIGILVEQVVAWSCILLLLWCGWRHAVSASDTHLATNLSGQRTHLRRRLRDLRHLGHLGRWEVIGDRGQRCVDRWPTPGAALGGKVRRDVHHRRCNISTGTSTAATTISVC